MADLITFGETMLRLSPVDGGRLSSADELALRTAGAESNVAIAAARLGTDAAWCSKLPDSPLGRRVRRDVETHGVDPLIAWSDTHRQGVYYLDDGEEPRGTDVVYDRADAAITTARPADLPLAAIERAACFFTTGITPALSDTVAETTTTLLEAAQRTAFDLNYRSKLWSHDEARAAYEALLPAVDVLFAPERDALEILGCSGPPEEIAADLRDRYGCDTVVLTRGEHGALARTPSGTVEQPVIPADTVDPIGTGDAFVGGYLSQSLAGADPRRCLAYAAATASLTRTLEGDLAAVTPAEVAAVLQERSEEEQVDRE